MNLITEDNDSVYYLYRHIRLDKNEVFYVGIGVKNLNRKKIKSRYPRAHTRHNRNTFWKNITTKTEYEIEILLESDDCNFIMQKEIEFIALYGRRDLGLGTLCNLCDGGTGFNRTSPRKGKKLSKEHIEKLRASGFFDCSRLKKKIYQYDLDGNFIREWDSCTEATEFYTGKKQNIAGSYAQQKHGFIKWKDSYWRYEKTDKIEVAITKRIWSNKSLNKRSNTIKRVSPKLEVINLETNETVIWNSTLEFLEQNPKFDRSCITACCNGYRNFHKGCKFKYLPKNDIKSNETNN